MGMWLGPAVMEGLPGGPSAGSGICSPRGPCPPLAGLKGIPHQIFSFWIFSAVAAAWVASAARQIAKISAGSLNDILWPRRLRFGIASLGVPLMPFCLLVVESLH